MKEAMSNFDVSAITFELVKVIKGSRVDNIYHIFPSTILLSLHPKNELIIEAGKRIHLTKYQMKKPSFPSSFCMNLRKHLKNGVIQDIRQPSLERIIFLDVSTKSGVFTLVAEFFGKGNIILLDDKERIMHALSYRRMRDRNIIRGEVFKLPPSRGINPLEVMLQDLLNLQKENVSCAKALSNLINIGSQYVQEALMLADIVEKKSCSELNENDFSKILHAIKSVGSKLVSGEYRPCVVFDSKGEIVDALPFPLAMYSGYEKKFYDTFNEAADEYFTRQLTKSMHSQKKDSIASKVRDYERILARQEKQRTFLEKAIQEYQKIGDLIYCHLNDLNELFRTLRTKIDLGEKWDNIVAEFSEQKRNGTRPGSIVESIDSAHGKLTVNLDGTPIELDFRLSIQDNATMYYNKVKQAKKKLSGAIAAIEKTRASIGKLELELLAFEEEAKEPVEKRKREWFEKFHWTYTSEGFLVIGGRDASMNEIIFKKYMEPDDILMHADIVGAPLVLIKTMGKSPSQATINEAAELSASYSRAWQMGFGSVDVYWFRPDQISKTSPSGGHLQKGSFIISGTKNYVRNVRLQISIGVKKINDRIMVIGGPPSSISAQTKIFINIVPGDTSSEKLAEQIKHELLEMAPQSLKQLISRTLPEDFQRFIPAKGGKILKDRT